MKVKHENVKLIIHKITYPTRVEEAVPWSPKGEGVRKDDGIIDFSFPKETQRLEINTNKTKH